MKVKVKVHQKFTWFALKLPEQSVSALLKLIFPPWWILLLFSWDKLSWRDEKTSFVISMRESHHHKIVVYPSISASLYLNGVAEIWWRLHQPSESNPRLSLCLRSVWGRGANHQVTEVPHRTYFLHKHSGRSSWRVHTVCCGTPKASPTRSISQSQTHFVVIFRCCPLFFLSRRKSR